jgi:hypothetical protein
MDQPQRKDFPVLVAEAQALGSIAVIRSLGRAGYPVHSCSANPSALGFESRFSAARALAPGYDDPSFPDWLFAYIRTNRIRAIIPSEGMLLAIRPRFQEFAPLLPFSPSEGLVYAGMSKADQLEIFSSGPNGREAGQHLPPFLLWNESQRIPERTDLSRLGFPLFLKVDGCYARGESGSAVHKAATCEEALEKLRSLTASYRRVLIEGYVPGRGTGAFFLMWDGKPRAEFMHIRVHEVPHTGGVSSYRKTWWHAEMRSDALSKLIAMKWQGVAMMEYRWDDHTDEFHFVEMNGRFWGSLHLALYAGVDFPLLLMDVFRGVPPPQEIPSVKQVSCRYTFPRDAMYVWSCWKDDTLKWTRKLAILGEFFVLSLNPAVRSDLWFPGDRRLYWKEFRNFLKSLRE